MTQGHPFPIIPITVPPFPPQLLALLLLPTQTYWEASSETTPVMLLGPSLPRPGILPRSLPSPLIRAPPSRPAAAHSGALGGVTWDRPGHATRACHITGILPPSLPSPLIRAPPSRPAAAHSDALGGVTWDRPGHATRDPTASASCSILSTMTPTTRPGGNSW